MDILIRNLKLEISDLIIKRDNIHNETKHFIEKKNKIETNLNELATCMDNDIFYDKTKEIYSRIYLKIKDNLDNFNINENDAVKKNDNISKCKYSNRGYCKFGQKCSFRHFKTNCEEYVTKGFCSSPKSCLFRHPKHCRYWTKKIVGCHRGEICQYLHDPSKKFIEAKENKVTTNKIIGSTGI